MEQVEKDLDEHEGYIGADLRHKREYASHRAKIERERALLASEQAKNRLYSNIPDLVYLLILLAGGGKYLHGRFKNGKT